MPPYQKKDGAPPCRRGLSRDTARLCKWAVEDEGDSGNVSGVVVWGGGLVIVAVEIPTGLLARVETGVFVKGQGRKAAGCCCAGDHQWVYVSLAVVGVCPACSQA